MAPTTDHETLAATISERVAGRMRDDILSGRFAPGARLKIADFAKLYGLSHMPIREALRRLEGEGLIEFSAHRGAAVRMIDASFIRSVYEVREALEGILAERCAERASPSDIQRLDQANQRFRDAAAQQDAVAMLERNRHFHAIIAEVAGNAEAARILETGRILIESLRLHRGRGAERSSTIARQHDDIIHAIRSGDASGVGILARRHVAEARDDLIARL